MAVQTIEVNIAQTSLGEILKQVREGVEIILVEDQKPVARLLPVQPAKKPRTPGLNAGLVTYISDDFDDPLPDEFWFGEDS